MTNQSTSDDPTSTAETSAIQCSSDHNLRSPCYCEENAWRLVYRHLHLNKDNDTSWRYNVVFISNKLRCCPMYRQRAAPNRPSEYVCWDYHVIVLRTRIIPSSSPDAAATKTEVLDIDTWLTPYPCPFEEYIHNTFPYYAGSNHHVKEQYLPLFRVIHATDYLKHFYSDRSHMFKDGKWSASPPNYKPITNGLQYRSNQGKSASLSNLEYYVNMSDEQATCVVSDARAEHRPLSLDEFCSRFS